MLNKNINMLPNDILCKIYTDTIKMKNRIDFDNNMYKYLKKEVIGQLNDLFYEINKYPDEYDNIFECIIETDNKSCYRLEEDYLTCVENTHYDTNYEEYNDIHTFIKNKLDNPLFYNKCYETEYFDKLWKYRNVKKNIK